jgi:tRNA-2-methylthio-N6-dimethylallyladenosine synthase
MKKFYLFVLGCQMNINDAERLRFLLINLGLEETSDAKSADIILTIACSVRQKPIDRIWGKLKIWKLATRNQYLVLTGCVVEADKKKFLEKFDLIFDVQKPQKLINFLKKKKLVDPKYSSSLVEKSFFALSPLRQTRERAYVSIGNGCNNFCTYCVVPYTRGREIYRPINEIISEVELALENGAKIISLIAQNVNSYKDFSCHPEPAGEAWLASRQGSQRPSLRKETEILRDAQNDKTQNDFVDLLKKINDLPGDFKIEFLTSHPKDMSDELIEAVAKLPKVIKWIHLPVQSGSNEILEKMNRKYTREHYLELVKKIRKAMPKVILTTDIIVGFPGETKAQFAETVDLVKKSRFDQAFVSKYSSRAGTVAAKMEDDVSPAEKKQRFQVLDKLINHK